MYGYVRLQVSSIRTRALVVLCALLFLAVHAACPQTALASKGRAANYGMDWTNTGCYNQLEVAERAGYYQRLAGYTDMTRSRALGRNVYEKLADTDPTGYRYRLVSVYTHASSGRIVLRPKDGEGGASCMYNTHQQDSNHPHGINGKSYMCSQQSRLRNLAYAPTCLWFHVQGCYTAETARQANLSGVRTTSGFTEKVWMGNTGLNGKGPHYNFAARYWKSLYEGQPQANALKDGLDQVWRFNWWHWGYNSFVRYGINGCI